MKPLLIALVAVFSSSLGATALAHPGDSSSRDRVLHKSGFVVSPAANSATPDATVESLVLHRSGVVVPGSSQLESQQARAATSAGSGTKPAPATSSNGLSALAVVLVCVGGVGALFGALYLGARLLRRHRVASTRIPCPAHSPSRLIAHAPNRKSVRGWSVHWVWPALRSPSRSCW